MKKLNVAMIGGGFMGKAHAMAYAAMPMFFWPAPAIPVRKVVVDVNDEMATTARDRFGFRHNFVAFLRTVDRTTQRDRPMDRDHFNILRIR